MLHEQQAMLMTQDVYYNTDSGIFVIFHFVRTTDSGNVCLVIEKNMSIA